MSSSTLSFERVNELLAQLQVITRQRIGAAEVIVGIVDGAHVRLVVDAVTGCGIVLA